MYRVATSSTSGFFTWNISMTDKVGQHMLGIIQDKSEDQDQGTQDQSPPDPAGDPGIPAAFSLEQDHQGQQDHGQGDQHGREYRSGPGGGNQKEHIPGHQRFGPAQQEPQEDIVKDIPDGKAVDEPGKSGAESPCLQ